MNGGRGLHGQAGMIGKLAVVWLVLLSVFALAAIDTVSIVITKFHTADLAANAASDAAASYQQSRSFTIACKVAIDALQSDDPQTKLASRGCRIDPSTGDASITVRKDATTLVAGRLSFTRKYASVTDTETAPPPSL